MAYVAISGDFMTRVKNKIEKMTQSELNTIGEEPSIQCNGGEPFVIQTLWGEHANLRNDIPSNWCSSTEELRIKFNIPEHFTAKGEPIQYHSKVKFLSPAKTPPRFSNYESNEVPNTEPILMHLVEWAGKRQEIINRWKEVQDKIRTFLHSCKSANEAVKLWPDIKAYFDPSDVQRLELKAVRAGSEGSDAAKVLAGIDTGEVMSAAVIARLSGAQV